MKNKNVYKGIGLTLGLMLTVSACTSSNNANKDRSKPCDEQPNDI